MSANLCIRRGVGDFLADQHLALARVVGDARRGHSLAEVVALPEEDRPRVQADVAGGNSAAESPSSISRAVGRLDPDPISSVFA